MPNFNFHLMRFLFYFKKLEVTSSECMVALNRKLLRFFPFYILFDCFIKLVLVVFTLFAPMQYLFSVNAEIISFHSFFPFKKSKIFIAMKVKSWVISHILHQIFLMYYFLHNCIVFV